MSRVKELLAAELLVLACRLGDEAPAALGVVRDILHDVGHLEQESKAFRMLTKAASVGLGLWCTDQEDVGEEVTDRTGDVVAVALEIGEVVQRVRPLPEACRRA